MKRVLVFIVAYHAESTLRGVLDRLPSELFENHEYTTDILIIDDSSADDTFAVGYEYSRLKTERPITMLKNPRNLGYGGNQKVGYHYAIDNGYDYVVLLHGDGQYAPEEMPRLLEPLLDGESEAVFGSRMLNAKSALKGGMPLYKFIGNKILTFVQNRLVGSRLSEYHSGYRLYSCKALASVPFERNSNYFDFDTDIIIQLHAAGMRIRELPIPTFYGNEICRVDGIRYARKIVGACARFRLMQSGIFYLAKFDVSSSSPYTSKFDFLSSHSMALEQVKQGDKILLLGSGPAGLIRPFVERGAIVTALDMKVDLESRRLVDKAYEGNLDNNVIQQIPSTERFDKVFALDVIEHLRSPEAFLAELRAHRATAEAEFILTTANIAFFPIRLMLLLGGFNYGSRGILDRTHTRLFTFSSLEQLFLQESFEIEESRGVPAPYPLAVGRNFVSRALLTLNAWGIKVLRGVCSYQMFYRCTALPTVELLLERAKVNTAHEISKKVANGTSHS